MLLVEPKRPIVPLALLVVDSLREVHRVRDHSAEEALMESSSKEDALARRRTQNRLAQRRFRWKRSQQQQQAQQQQPPKQPEVEIQPDNTPRPHQPSADAVLNALVPERELGDVPSPGGLLNNLLDNISINSPPAQSPVSRCRFRLLGNAALLASTSWMDTSDKVEPSSADCPTDVASRPAGLGFSTDILPSWTPESMPLSESQPNPTDVPGLLHRSPEVDHNVEDGGVSGRRDSWQGPLHIAAQKGHDQIVRLLLQHAMDCNERDSDGLTPLFYAIRGGFEGIATALLDSGARIDLVDEQQRNAVHLAVAERRAGLLKLLLDRSDGKQGLIDSYDVAGMTPLHTAIDMGFEAGVQLLLQFGANLNYRARKN